MKTLPLILVGLMVAFVCQSQPAPAPAPPPPLRPPVGLPPGRILAPPAVAAKDPVNYLIRVEWKEPKGNPRFLELLTTEGQFNLNTIQTNSVKINNVDVPITLKFSGTLNALDEEKGRLQLFLGRTVPYVTGSYSGSSGANSSYSQMSVGLDSAFIVKFGKSQVIQSDENGQISVLVKRMEE